MTKKIYCADSNAPTMHLNTDQHAHWFTNGQKCISYLNNVVQDLKMKTVLS